MRTLLSRADSMLRPRTRPAESAEPLALTTTIVVFGLLYGAVMGTFSGLRWGNGLQVLYSALKVPLLLLVTGALSLPGFFVLYTLIGLRADFSRVVQALLAAQSAMTVILASLSPFTLLWYASCADYNAAIVFNALVFATAALLSQCVLRREYAPLIRRNPRHRRILRLWMLTYGFVGIQMGWLLRPFVGMPDRPATLFRVGAWGNAYEELLRIVSRVGRR